MLPNRSAAQLAPLLIRHGHRAGFRRGVSIPQYMPAIAILVPRKTVSTDTSTGRSDGQTPPPGFNIEQAKKPLSKDAENASEQSKTGQSSSSPSSASSSSKPDGQKIMNINIPATKPSESAPTRANEQVAMAELAQHKTAAEKSADKKDVAKAEDKKRRTIWQWLKHEVMHYWDGTKLLATEVKISSRLGLKMAAGYELTRREHRQLHRTVQDLGRLVPFSVFVLVPFAELLLPVALKLFPNMLPSTYEDAKSKESKAKRLRSSRKEVSKFLRDTLRESGLPVSPATTQKEEFTEFFRKIRATGETPSKSDVIKVCKLFKDDLTLDNLSRPQLVGICRYMNLVTFGTDAMLRYQVRHRMRQIKRDDSAIAFEGVSSLSVPELQSACAVRGLRTHGMSPGRLRDDLQLWLDLRLKYGVPSTLLVLSNAFMYAQGKEAEFESQLSALEAVLSSIPEELFHEIELEVHNAEGATTNKQRLQVLKEQQELIQEENEQAEQQRASGREDTNVDDKEDIDEKEEDTKQQEALAKTQSDGAVDAKSDAQQEMLESERDLEHQQQAKTEQQAEPEQQTKPDQPKSQPLEEPSAGKSKGPSPTQEKIEQS